MSQSYILHAYVGPDIALVAGAPARPLPYPGRLTSEEDALRKLEILLDRKRAVSAEPSGTTTRPRPHGGQGQKVPFRLSRQQVLSTGLAGMFEMRFGGPINDEPNYVGMSKQGRTLLQLIGDENSLTQATIIAYLNKDDKMGSVFAIRALRLFIDGVAPEWNERQKWLEEAMKKAVTEEVSEQTKALDASRLTMTWVGMEGSFKLEMAPNPASSGSEGK